MKESCLVSKLILRRKIPIALVQIQGHDSCLSNNTHLFSESIKDWVPSTPLASILDMACFQECIWRKLNLLASTKLLNCLKDRSLPWKKVWKFYTHTVQILNGKHLIFLQTWMSLNNICAVAVLSVTEYSLSSIPKGNNAKIKDIVKNYRAILQMT